MGLKISDLLKWKKPIKLLNPVTNNYSFPDDDGNENEVTVWLRVLGDKDLEEAKKAARKVSANLRKELENKESEEYLNLVEPISYFDKEEVVSLIIQARGMNLEAVARANVPRPELAEIADIAEEPDAPTLEELERLDKIIERDNKEYENAIQEYMEVRVNTIKAELEVLSDEELRQMARGDLIAIAVFKAYMEEELAEYMFRASYTDVKCTQRAFDSLEEYKQTDERIKDQLIEAYAKLNIDGNALKN